MVVEKPLMVCLKREGLLQPLALHPQICCEDCWESNDGKDSKDTSTNLSIIFTWWFSSGRKIQKKLLYFEWSPPWHAGWRLSGEGCRHTVLFCHFVHIISCGPFSWRAPGKQPRSKHVKHVQTCQNMSGYDLTNISKKQKSNMSVDLLKQDQKLLQQQRCMLKHAKTCQDTTWQTYHRNRNQTCQ